MNRNTCFLSTDINDALTSWSNGGLVAIPTETVFGLGAPINKIDLIHKIFAYKERPFYDPLIVHVSGVGQAKECVRNWNSVCDKLVKKFWPGPLTLVLPKRPTVDNLITSGLDTVGVRCPRNKKTLALLNKIGVGVAAPSANKFTKTSPTKVEHVFQSFKDYKLCILESEETCDVGIESTIIKVIDEKTVEILRPGIITKSEIEDSLPDVSVLKGITAREGIEQREAPGQDKIHYRPAYPLYYYHGEPKNLKSSSAIEVTYLQENPYIAARELYSLMLTPITLPFRARLLILPEELKRISLKEREVWESVIDKISKAGILWS